MLVGGTVLAAVKGAQILDMGLQVLGAWWSYMPILAEPNPRPIPTYDFFWPALALLGGFATFAVGWVSPGAAATRAVWITDDSSTSAR